MRRSRLVLVLVAFAMVASAFPAQAGRHGRGRSYSYWNFHYGWGPSWGAWWGPGWYGPVGRNHELSPDLAVVDTDIAPEHALVFLDGELIGTADDFDGFPDYLYLEPGSYKLEFKLGGFAPLNIELKVRSGRYYQYDQKLARNPAEKESPWYDRPAKRPRSRVFGPSQEAEPRERSGADPELRVETRKEPAEVEDLPARPAAGTAGTLELKVSPANAAVYLDGELVGTGEELGRLARGLAVAAGPHKVEAFAPGRTPRLVDVDVKEGELQQVVIELEQKP
jgi:hypothetical protein